MYVGGQFCCQLFQTRQRHIGDGDVGTHACSNACSSLTHSASSKYQYLGRFYTRHACHQLTLATLGLLQIVGTILRGHASCHLAHRNEQG